MGESERGTSVERVEVTFWCQGGHPTLMRFAATADLPEQWDCRECGGPAGLDAENPPAATVTAPFKSHLAYVRDRRSEAEAEILLAEALAKLRGAS